MSVPLPPPKVRITVVAALVAALAVILIIDRSTCAALLRFCYNMVQAIFSSGGVVAVHLLLVGIGAWIGLRVLLALLLEAIHRQRWSRGIQRARLRGNGGFSRAEVVVVSRDAFALTTGWLRPTSYFSTTLLGRLSRSERLAVLAHERAHRERRDPLRLFVWRVVAAALPFFPLVREFARAAATDYESAADRRAAATGVSRSSLLSAIAVTLRAGGTLPHWAAAHFALETDILSRLRQLHGEPDRRQTPMRAVALTVVAFVVLVAPLLALRANARTMNHVLQCEAPTPTPPTVPMSEQPERLTLPPNSSIRLIESRAASYPHPRP